MKKILTLVLVSALGGILTLGAYKLFLEEEKTVTVADSNIQPAFLPTNNISSSLKAYEDSGFTSAAENTINAVVHVKNVTVSRGQMTIQDLFSGRAPKHQQRGGTGSGVIITPDGYIITNNHVIDNSEELSVTLNNNKTYEAKIIGTDPKTDIALLKIETDEKLPIVAFGDSDNAKIGEWVLAVGNPFNLTSTVTAGIISAKARDFSDDRISQSFIQTDAAVNPGNSGGALVNTKGELIGINTAITSQTGSYIGYSFAVPSNIARKVIEDIMEYGTVQTGVLGIRGGSLDNQTAKNLGIKDTEGVFINEVTSNSGAEKAGLQNGDVIKKLDNIEVSKFEDLSGYIKTKGPNDIVNVEILRNNELRTIPVTLSKIDILSINFLKMKLGNIPSSIKKKYDIKNGVIVEKTNNEYLYRNLGITKGFIITGINDVKIEALEDISKLKEKYGDDILEKIKKLEYINRDLEKKEVIFR